MSLCKDSQNLLQAITEKVFYVQVNIGILLENKVINMTNYTHKNVVAILLLLVLTRITRLTMIGLC